MTERNRNRSDGGRRLKLPHEGRTQCTVVIQPTVGYKTPYCGLNINDCRFDLESYQEIKVQIKHCVV